MACRFQKAAAGNPRAPTTTEAADLLAKLRETSKGSGRDTLRKALQDQFDPK